MRLFSQSLIGEARKWYRFNNRQYCQLATISSSFCSHWEIKKYPLQILVEYESLRRSTGDLVQDYLQEIQFKIIQIDSIRFIILFQWK